MSTPGRLTTVHVTHEAGEKIGGIGTVLEGLLTSPVYQQHIARSILIGPLFDRQELASEPHERLGPDGTVLYSSMDKIDELGLGSRFRPIEWSFNVSILYGKKTYRIDGDDRTGEAEVLLIDVFQHNPDRLKLFKFRLAETFGIDSSRYDDQWEYDEYVRLAEPAFYASIALLDRRELPAILFAHEFMGLPTALKAAIDGEREFRSVFHAHECAPARRLVECHHGHDISFYSIMQRAREQGRYVCDVFGDQSDFHKFALVSRAHLCDGMIAVGRSTAEELHFLDRHFDHHHIDLVFNGIPAMEVTMERKQASREKLLAYAERLVGYRPDVLMTHVTRPVISKGLWRDVAVCETLDRQFAREGMRGILFLLTTGGGTRRHHDVVIMEEEYGWPRHHREGYPDLVGPEVDINAMIDAFNQSHEHIQIVLVNQFGWSRERLGNACPEGMDFADLRFATDVEFGMATYEPFGISPLEPLAAGAICVISTVCGCADFARQAAGESMPDNILIADYVGTGEGKSTEELLDLTIAARDAMECPVSKQVAEELFSRLPRDDDDRARLREAGQTLVKRMGWDQVIEQGLLPTLHRVLADTP